MLVEPLYTDIGGTKSEQHPASVVFSTAGVLTGSRLPRAVMAWTSRLRDMMRQTFRFQKAPPGRFFVPLPKP